MSTIYLKKNLNHFMKTECNGGRKLDPIQELKYENLMLREMLKKAQSHNRYLLWHNHYLMQILSHRKDASKVRPVRINKNN